MKVDPKLQQPTIDPFAQGKSAENQLVQQNTSRREANKPTESQNAARNESASVNISQPEKTEGPRETEPLSSPEEARELAMAVKASIMQDSAGAKSAQANLTNQSVLEMSNG